MTIEGVLNHGSEFPCPSCGKKIPLEGRTCPFCHQDKTSGAEAYREQLKAKAADNRKGIVGCLLMGGGFMLGSTIGAGFDQMLSTTPYLSFVGAAR